MRRQALLKRGQQLIAIGVEPPGLADLQLLLYQAFLDLVPLPALPGLGPLLLPPHDPVIALDLIIVCVVYRRHMLQPKVKSNDANNQQY